MPHIDLSRCRDLRSKLFDRHGFDRRLPSSSGSLKLQWCCVSARLSRVETDPLSDLQAWDPPAEGMHDESLLEAGLAIDDLSRESGQPPALQQLF